MNNFENIEGKEWFETWFDSPFHRLLYPHRNEEEAQYFIHHLLPYLQPKENAKAIDVGCGKGRHAYELSQNGMDVTGIDLSEVRIEIAKELENERLRFFIHDMRDPFAKDEFDYVFNFFTSFGYFHNKSDTEKTANNFVEMLHQGGTLVLDYLNTHIAEKNLNDTEHVVKEGISFDIKRKLETGTFWKFITVNDPKTGIHHYKEEVDAFILNDFKELFEPLGMELIDVFGDYALNDFDIKTSPRLIMVWRKK